MDIKHLAGRKGLILGDFISRTVWFADHTGNKITQLLPDKSLQVCNHSPTGFNWGYGGSGPAQLALALLLYYTHDEKMSLQLYQRFKEEVIATFPQADFDVSEASIIWWIRHAMGE